MANKRRPRARKGSGSMLPRGSSFVARLDLGVGGDGQRIRRSKAFATRRDAQAWIDSQRSNAEELLLPVAHQRLDEYLHWWLEHEAPNGKPGRAPLAETTLQSYRINVERHLIPVLGHQRVGQLTVSDLDAFASRKLLDGHAPSTVNRIRETLRSALSTAVRQDRLTRNVARYGGGVGAAPPPVDRFSDEELSAILRAARDEHYFPSSCCSRGRACGSVRPAGCGGATWRCARPHRGSRWCGSWTSGARSSPRSRRAPAARSHSVREWGSPVALRGRWRARHGRVNTAWTRVAVPAASSCQASGCSSASSAHEDRERPYPQHPAPDNRRAVLHHPA